jgi:hypothetical protein
MKEYKMERKEESRRKMVPAFSPWPPWGVFCLDIGKAVVNLKKK